jgi:hypothetical protein
LKILIAVLAALAVLLAGKEHRLGPDAGQSSICRRAGETGCLPTEVIYIR